MDDGSPQLGVGFAIEAGNSFGVLEQIARAMDSTEAQVIKDAASIERATSGMLNLGGATASISTFGSATTRELQSAARETAKAEKAGEAMVRSLERQASTFGKTTSEIRAMKAESAALAAEQTGNADLAARIRAAEQSLYEAEYAAMRRATIAAEELAHAKTEAAIVAEREAAALASAAAAAERDAREHAALAAMVRASHDAQVADAAAAELMRERTDPLYAAVKRLNAEIAESTRLYHQGATAPAEYARQQEVLAQRMRATTEQHNLMAVAGRGNANSLKMMAIQFPDIVQGLLTGQKPFTIFIQQGGQIAQIAMMAEGGLKGMALQLGRLALVASPVLAGIGLAAGGAYVAFKGFQDQVKDDGELTRYRDSLGLTRKEMEQLSYGVEKAGGKIKSLGPVTITFGDEMAGIWKTISDQANASGTWDSIKSGAGAAFDWILEAWQKTAAGITAGIKGTANAIVLIWNAIPPMIGQVFVNAANLAIGAMNALVRAGVSQINGFITGVNTVLPAWMKMGQISAPQMDYIKGFEGAKGLGKAIGKGYTDAYTTAREEDKKFWAQSGANAKKHAKDAMDAEAAAIKANRTPKAAPKPKVDHNALNAEAVESQIKNLYKLADAYGASGASALVAEAREKAESEAIKKRGDIEEYVNRQIRLSIAQRVADGAKATAALREQADIQSRVNDMVAAGLVPADRAAELVSDQMELLPLLAAQTAALHENDKRGYEAATDAIKNMTAEQERLNKSKRDAQYLAAMSAGADQLDMLQREFELIGKTDNIRVHELAVLKATQDAKRLGFDGEKAQAYIDQQVEIADKTQNLTDAQNAYNDSLSFTADKWDQIARNVQDAANGMSDAFGAQGKAIGDIAAIYATYRANEEDVKKLRKANADSSATQAQKDRKDALLQLKSQGQQIQMYGDMVGAAKGFFSEKSKIYKALQAAEMAYRAVQLAMSIASMFQDTAETGTHVANAAARATANATEGVTAQAKLPFPANIAAMAATAAAVIAMGVSMLGGHGGGHVVAPPTSEDLQKKAGTGTLLGSPNDKSASIAHSLDLVAKNTDGVLAYNSQMLSSLRSIDASIGAMAATVAKQINIAGGLGDTSKLGIGSSGSAGFLGLFSSSTTRTLYDAGITLAATTVGNIVANGISGSTYQIVEQVKKSSGFLGIGGGTKTTYQTTTGGLPSDVAASIQSVIGALENGIVTAAGAIGINSAKAMLDNFTVSIGQMSFNGLDAQGIEDQLNAVFSTVGDQMVSAILPGIGRFQKVGEGLFETLERVASTVGAVDAVMQRFGRTTTTLGIDVDMGIASMFDSVGDFNTAANSYFEGYYSTAEQTAAKTAELNKVFGSLNLAMPDTLAQFRALVEAQDLTTAAGQAAFATLLQLAPAFADLKSSMDGAKSAADITSERLDLQRQLLQLQGNTAALRALDLAKVDPSNRALQQQIYDLQDAQDAAKAAQDLATAWKTVGDSITDEIKRIRGLASPGADTFASLQGQFNAATTAARGGDQDAAKSLPQLSQAMLTAAANVATSQQELRRVQAQTAASLEATFNAITAITGSGSATTTSTVDKLLAAISTSQTANAQTAANDDVASQLDALRAELAGLREDNNKGHAQTAANTGSIKKTLDNVTPDGDAISTRAA